MKKYNNIEFELEETRRAATRRELNKKLEEAKANFKTIEDEYKALLVQINGLNKEISRETDLIKMSTAFTENLELFQGETFRQRVDVNVQDSHLPLLVV